MRTGHDIQISIVRSSPHAAAMTAATMRPAAYRRPAGERAGAFISTALLVLSTGVACFDLHLLLKIAAA